jgi:hypothetical protein
MAIEEVVEVKETGLHPPLHAALIVTHVFASPLKPISQLGKTHP